MTRQFLIVCLLLLSWELKASNFYSISNADLDKISAFMPKMKVVSRDSNLTLMKLELSEVHVLSHFVHEKLNKCAGFKYHPSLKSAQHSIRKYAQKKSHFNGFVDYSINQQDLVRPMMNQVSEEKIISTINLLSSVNTRYVYDDSSRQASWHLNNVWKDLTKHRTDVSLENLYLDEYKLPSVVLTIMGSETPDEVVVLGGHLDSLATGAGSEKRSPGVDDNASGIASITEVLRILMENDIRPKKTLKFMAYTAEEVGLHGSQDIAQKYAENKVNVIGVMQLDMTLFKGSQKDIYIISDHTSKPQNEFLARLVDEYVKVPWAYSTCGYSCSDHSSWDEAGFPASFAFEAELRQANRYIHSKNDDLEHAGGNGIQAVKFTKLATAYVMEMVL